MKNKALLVLSSLCLITLTGCNLFIDNSSNNNNSSQSEDPIIYGNDPVIENSEEYLTFWNSETYLSINISMSQEAANFINEHQNNHDDSTYFDYYVPCTFTLIMNDTTYVYEEVGIREKGNMSRNTMLVDNNFSLESLAHYKLSFKQTFDGDEYTNISYLTSFKKTWSNEADRNERKNRTLFGMEKIDIKWNRNDDETKSKQSFALKLFRDNGVLAGHDTLAKTTLGIESGSSITTTYEVLECIDSIFIKRHFSELYADGDLYKCCYTSLGLANFSTSYKVNNQIGIEDNTKNYHPVYDLKTNKKKSTSHTNLLNFISVQKDKSSSAEDFKTKIEEVLDVESFIKYESIAFLLGNFDDMRNNANNYYIYFASSNNKAFIIPYDFDRCLGAGCEGRKTYMTDFSAESTKMQCSNGWQSINLYWRICCTTTDSSSGHANEERVEEYRSLYQSNIEDLLNNKTISYDSFKEYVNSFPSEYAGNPDGAGENNTTFANYLNLKISEIKSDVYTSGYNIEV